MALETVTTIYDLVATNPTLGDPVSQGDDHLRNIKTGLLASFARSIAGSGYQKIGQAIIQWGASGASTTGTAVTFPLAFPNACLVVVATTQANSSAIPVVGASGTTTTGFNLFCNTSTPQVSWLALGY